MEKGISLSDITEVRPGINSHSFRRTGEHDAATKCLSKIGSERTVNIEMPTQDARDLMLQKFRLLLRHYAEFHTILNVDA